MSDLIESKPGKMGGRPCLAGTRITAASIASLLDDGCPPEDVMGLFPSVTPDHIEAVREWARTKPYSDEADERSAQIVEKEDRGEKVGWADLAGICARNPRLPDCGSYYDRDSDVKCDLPNHHDGPHRVTLEW